MPAQNNTENQWCSVCKAGSFSLSAERSDGCIPCVCMGISSECTRALFTEQSDYSQITYANQSLIYVATASGEKADGYDIASVNVDGKLMVQCQVSPNMSVFWKDPSLQGNLLTFYGSTVYFSVNWIKINADASGTPITPKAILIDGRNRTFQFELSHSVSPNMTSALQFTITATISCVLIANNSKSSCSREDLLIALTDVQSVLLPASYHTSAHLSRYVSLNVVIMSLNIKCSFI